jgi:transcriptional regulator with XRE-family HTH domain
MHTNSCAYVREREGLTQQELARAAGVAQSTIARFETGENTPNIETAKRIAQTLGVTLEELLSPPPDAPKPKQNALVAEARYTARQALLHAEELQARLRDGEPQKEWRWVKRALNSHREALAHQLLSIPESERPTELKKLIAQVWLQ